MTDKSADEMRQQAAAQFDRNLDPLKQYERGFEEAGIDPFWMFEDEILATDDLSDETLKGYDVTFRQWKVWMDEQGRHPACPNERHVRDFITVFLRGQRDNSDGVIRQKLNKLNRVYEYCQNDDGLPHPSDVNPFKAARQKVNLSNNDKDPVPRIEVDEMATVLGNTTHTLYRAIVGTQVKLGLRRGELANIKLADVNIDNNEVNEHYDMGTVPQVRDRPNTVYIPPDRDGNKSKRPRVLPLDDEVRSLLVRYLLIRPTVDEDWLFLAKRSYGKLRNRSINEAWKHAFEDYETGQQYRDVTSHFARHYFSNYWETKLAELGHPLKYIMYMRGDKIKADSYESHSIDHYLQGYYEDIEDIYREHIYRMGLGQ